MKKIILAPIFIFVIFSLFAQKNYNEAIQQGDNALEGKDYTTAIKKYLIAETFDPSKWEIVQEKLGEVYVNIEKKQQELEETKIELKLITAQREKLEHKLSSTKEEIEQIKQKLEFLESQVRSVLNATNTIIIQTNQLENKLLQTE